VRLSPLGAPHCALLSAISVVTRVTPVGSRSHDLTPHHPYSTLPMVPSRVPTARCQSKSNRLLALALFICLGVCISRALLLTMSINVGDSDVPNPHTGLVEPENEKLKQLLGHANGVNFSAGLPKGRCPFLQLQTGVEQFDDDHALKVGPRGPTLLEDQQLREKIMHFDHERSDARERRNNE
jgi:hypothetical protein